MRRRASICLLFVLVCASFGTGRTPAAAADPSPKFGPHVTALIAEAAKEGHVDLSWSASGFADNGKGVSDWLDSFNRFYGMHLSYTYTPSPAMSQQVTSLIQQTRAGVPAPTNVMILGSDQMLPLIDAKATRSYDWATLAKEVGVTLPAAAVAPGGSGVAFATAVFGIAYNSKAVPADQVPHTLSDLLKPQWKGRIGSTLDAVGFNYLSSLDPKWGPAKTEAYVKAFSQQLAGLTRCNQTAPMLDGQFDLTVFWCDVNSVIVAKEGGAPLNFVVPRDAPLINYWYMAVPKTSPAPAAGALFALFMLTKQGQALNWKWDRHDLTLLPGSHSAAFLPSDPAKVPGAKGIQDFMSHPETLQYMAQYMQILRAVAPK